MSERKLTGYPSIDKPWLRYYEQFYDKEMFVAPYPQATMYEFLHRHSSAHLKRTALRYYGNRITYKQLFWQIDRVAKAFCASGVKAGDVVSICMPNTPEGIYSLYALNRIGAVVCLIDPRTAPEGIKDYVNETQSQILVVIDLCLHKVAEVLNETTLKTIIAAPVSTSMPAAKRCLYLLRKLRTPRYSFVTSWLDFIRKRKKTYGIVDAEGASDVLAIIGHTGGTTGEPKGVELTNGACNMLVFQQQYTEFMKGGNTALGIMPLFSAYGAIIGVHMPLCCGKEIILIPKFAPEEFDQLVLKHKPNDVVGVPAFWEYLANNGRAEGKDLSFLKCVVSGGDKLNPEVEKNVNAFLERHGCKVRLIKGYGLTEICSCAALSYVDACNAPGSVGMLLYGNNCKIVEPGTCDEVACGISGEVCLNGPTLMRGYYKNNEATKQAMKRHSDGEIWFHTGDIGYISEDGLLYIQDRIKRIIIGPNGHTVFPILSETIIAKHPLVKSCAMVGKADALRKSGLIPTAYVVLSPETTDELMVLNELDMLCKRYLPECDCPYVYKTIAAMPVTSAGKIDYRALERTETESA